jgi:hypothetical protein
LRSTFRASFGRDLKRIRSDRMRAGVLQAILDVEAATDWGDVPNIKKIKGSTNAYRILLRTIGSAWLLKQTMLSSCAFCRDATSIANSLERASLEHEQACINPLAQRYAGREDFSELIRQRLLRIHLDLAAPSDVICGSNSWNSVSQLRIIAWGMVSRPDFFSASQSSIVSPP